ncbi:CinA-like protein [Cloacibacterium rupense]|uniref:CinA-like protein n=1 Tax=Cloacibacterium rupense TaxID=517423 RepID=A0ABQ2NMQ0_9FLAO|nr:CinA family nicotinamide mononucleotide deamidase-related protein [Cloacibacterium rupense]GGP06092.1 CinA-like protein [Cloacibacterium rupense]
MKKAVLITIGDEILSGNTIDTNSNFIATQLKNIGFKVVQIFTISDEIETIKKTLKSAFEIGDLVITTGGLGPTKDDKTKKAFAEFFNDTLVSDAETLEHLRQLLIKRNREHLFDINLLQADILSKSKVFQNHNGTAPSLMVEENGKIAICLPGVPYEVKPLIKNQIIPFLQEKFEQNFIVSRIISVVNFPESLLSETIESWELALPENISLSYLPIANRVKLRLTALGKNEEILNQELDGEISKLRPLIQNHIISESGDSIEEILRDLLISKKLTISTAESCTGGELSRLITSVSGSSYYFLGGICTYQTQKKTEILGVSEKLVQEKTVVSEEVAQAMSLGGQKLFKTDISLSTTGVAGPNSDEFESEVGTVFYSIRVQNFEKTFKLYLPHLERKDFMNFVSMKVLQDLIEILIREKI